METVSDMAAAPNAYARAMQTAMYVRQQLPEALQYPKVAIVCGSGLGGLADTIEAEPKVELAYGTIPNFPKSTGECIYGSIISLQMRSCGLHRMRGTDTFV